VAEGTWRGLHPVGMRDSLAAINGIGHAAVATDPEFRAVLAAHGFTLEPATGELVELAPLVGRFSARTAQIGRNLDRYEAQWPTAEDRTRKAAQSLMDAAVAEFLADSVRTEGT
jgi:exodeoxyribonuclease V alpha subunit